MNVHIPRASVDYDGRLRKYTVHRASLPLDTQYYGPENERVDNASDFSLGGCEAGDWVAISLPEVLFVLPDLRSGRFEGGALKEAPPYALCLHIICLQAEALQETQRPKPVSAYPDPEEELRRRIEQRARDLPFPDACLVKRLEAMRDTLPQDQLAHPPQGAGQEPIPSALLGDRALIPAPRWIWEGDLAARLAIITQSSENIWLRSKQPVLHRIRREHAHVAILLPKGFSDPHIREVRPWRLKEVSL